MSVSRSVRVMRIHLSMYIFKGLPGSSHATRLLCCRMASASDTYGAATRSNRQTKGVAAKAALADSTASILVLNPCIGLNCKRHIRQKYRQQDHRTRNTRTSTGHTDRPCMPCRRHKTLHDCILRLHRHLHGRAPNPVLQQPKPAHPHTRARAPAAA